MSRPPKGRIATPDESAGFRTNESAGGTPSACLTDRARLSAAIEDESGQNGGIR